MGRKLMRALGRADDVLEIVVIGAARLVARTWKPVLAAGLLLGGAAYRGRTLFDPPKDPELTVLAHVCSSGCVEGVATVRHEGIDYTVRPGAVIPPADPHLVITHVDGWKVRALAIDTWKKLEWAAPEGLVSPEPVHVVAIAGEFPDFVAVIEWRKETYIVQPGARVPCDQRAEFTVTGVAEDVVEYTCRTGGDFVHRARLLPDPEILAPQPPAPHCKMEEIDIPDITP